MLGRSAQLELRADGTAKTGAIVAPVFGGRGSLPLLAALLLPALGSLFRHCALSPPSLVGSTAKSLHRIAAPLPPGTLAVRLPALIASC
jgi:hypothetical protein